MKARMPKFGAVPVALFKEPGLTLADVRVYAVLAMFQGNNDDSYPSRETIAENANISVESVSRAISHLVEMEWAERDQRGLGKSNIYRVMVETDDSRNATDDISGNATDDATEMLPVTLPSILQKDHFKKSVTDKGPRHKHGEYGHVLLTSSDLDKIKLKFPLDWERRITDMDKSIEQHGYKYKNFYLAILDWARRDIKAPNVTAFSPSPTPKLIDLNSDTNRQLAGLFD